MPRKPSAPRILPDREIADEEWDFEAPIEALPGSGSEPADDTLRDGLLELYSYVSKIAVLLEEADEDEFRAVAVRLRRLKKAVDELPEKGRPRGRIGFSVRKRVRS